MRAEHLQQKASGSQFLIVGASKLGDAFVDQA